jgi:hypothetical protein
MLCRANQHEQPPLSQAGDRQSTQAHSPQYKPIPSDYPDHDYHRWLPKLHQLQAKLHLVRSHQHQLSDYHGLAWRGKLDPMRQNDYADHLEIWERAIG